MRKNFSALKWNIGHKSAKKRYVSVSVIHAYVFADVLGPGMELLPCTLACNIELRSSVDDGTDGNTVNLKPYLDETAPRFWN